MYDILSYYHTGPLSSVGDLSYSFINSSTVNITWSPPFTLPGTIIMNYNISVAMNVGGNACLQTSTKSYYIFSLLTKSINTTGDSNNTMVPSGNGNGRVAY